MNILHGSSYLTVHDSKGCPTHSTEVEAWYANISLQYHSWTENLMFRIFNGQPPYCP